MANVVRYLNPPGASPIFGAYSHVAIVEPGRLAFIAGQVAVDQTGAFVGPGEFPPQVAAVFDNIERILSGLGVGFDAVVEFTTYVVGEAHLKAWFEARTKVYERIFPDKRYPPNTLVVVAGLNRPELLLEISCVARVP
jgi:enamine deaminase RidA (YjgF/YER057c/UK114 family)